MRSDLVHPTSLYFPIRAVRDSGRKLRSLVHEAFRTGK